VIVGGVVGGGGDYWISKLPPALRWGRENLVFKQTNESTNWYLCKYLLFVVFGWLFCSERPGRILS
jgi:hypothetical protein